MKKMLEVIKLAVRIKNQVICDGLDLTIHAGEKWGILGANGSGKSTLLHTFAGLHPAPHSETYLREIYLQGKNIATLSRKEIAKQMAVLFQTHATYFSQSVFEYCLRGRHPHRNTGWESAADRQIALDALRAMQLQDKTQCRVQDLSGGERQRLAVAAVITQTPQLFLLDEPTNHLDLYYQVKLLDFFKDLAEEKGISTVMTLHDVNMAQHYCTHVLMLFSGGETLQGRTAVMLTAENLQRLYQHQLYSVSDGEKCYWFPELGTCKSG